MSLKDTVRTWIVNLLDLDSLGDVAVRNRIERLAELRDYYDGIHKKQLKVKAGKFNDNLTINLVGLIVDKAVSALVGDPADGHGLSWTFPSETEDATPKSIEWLNEQWDANDKEIFLHKNALSGAESGFPCIKIVPDGAGGMRLVNINPLLLTVDTDPQDQDQVTRYIIRYIVNENDKEVAYKEVTEQNGSNWQIATYRQASGKRWEPANPPVLWQYDFPPILAWQNLPSTDSPYGRSDIEGLIPIQDRLNFVISNLSKIVRLYAHPQRFGMNLSQQMIDGQIALGPDEMPLFNGTEGAGITQLAAVGDLPAAIQFENKLREYVFTIAREVDVSLFKDKVGQVTNMGLRMMYKDALEKLGTKRMLYGNAYQELNRRMLVLGNFEPEICTINWPDPLPVNEAEEVTAITSDLNNKLVSTQTASKMRGYDWEHEQELMATEASTTQNAGSLLLSNFFNQGK